MPSKRALSQMSPSQVSNCFFKNASIVQLASTNASLTAGRAFKARPVLDVRPHPLHACACLSTPCLHVLQMQCSLPRARACVLQLTDNGVRLQLRASAVAWAAWQRRWACPASAATGRWTAAAAAASASTPAASATARRRYETAQVCRTTRCLLEALLRGALRRGADCIRSRPISSACPLCTCAEHGHVYVCMYAPPGSVGGGAGEEIFASTFAAMAAIVGRIACSTLSMSKHGSRQ